MSLALLASLRQKLAEQISFVQNLTSQVESEGRDLVEAEETQLQAARQRISALNKQIEPLAEMESVIAAAGDTVAQLSAAHHIPAPRQGGTTARLSASRGGYVYDTAGAFIVDHLKARGNEHLRIAPDPQAAERVRLAMSTMDPHQQAMTRQGLSAAEQLAHQTTSDVPGLLPKPIIGAVLNLLDASRPLISSLGVKPMDSIPGTSFSRPKVSQHTTAGKQTAEKTELPSRQLKVTPVDFAKETYGGWVNVSRQTMDWTSPAAWDILIADLADQYAIETEEVVSAAFALIPLAGNTVARTGGSLAEWGTALYLAAAKVYGAVKRLPDRIWVSVDQWAEVGPVVDAGRLQFPPTASPNAGSSSLDSFAGNMFALPRIVVPGFPAGTFILGVAGLYEVYEERIGLLSAVEPSVLGVQVAYGGYLAHGTMDAGGFAKITPPAPDPEP